ncbi:dTDP-4-dehydrorhamnose 3,5-epimerase [Litoribacter alkaliphilus]|uniref:dTDP-4-dehydrorhamnose 3,5-epimerase n=1 Tax=Litoribacter ruber TaxID=702568 RepID=A0AAP2CML3_9BACT|nr:dTDP-4-dehydrorhamnose 3,5-epimerase [Litoribacter alkaliphilus]MBS9525345.1 dTDP-4-dehydrorhamnose 3,5-epimerase [Litoribacter alkaliphilus]
MEIKQVFIQGVYEIYPRAFSDERGYFLEVFREDLLRKNGIAEIWVQENQSFSKKGTIRGLHFQKEPFAQAKLARVIVGKVWEVCVDLRKNSPTFGMHHAVVLDDQQHNMLYLPAGFAHGFAALEDTVFSYRCSNHYNKESEGGVIWDDADLAIDWQVENPILSDKDILLPSLKEFVKDSGGGL